MYYPYITGFRSNLLAIEELAGKIRSTGTVVPIIELLNLDPDSLKFLKTANDFKMPFILISNSSIKGLKVPDINKIKIRIFDKVLKDNKCYKMGLIIDSKISMGEIELFIESFSGAELALIHMEEFSHPARLANLVERTPGISTQIFFERNISKRYLLDVDMRTQVILLSDFFWEKHIVQPGIDSEIFSKHHSLYKQSGFDGFGDFTVTGRCHSDIIRKHKQPQGINISFLVKNNGDKTKEIWIKSFRLAAEGKIQYEENISPELISELVKFLKRLPSYSRTDSITEFLDCYSNGQLPDLETLRKLTVRHHIELEIKCLETQENKTTAQSL